MMQKPKRINIIGPPGSGKSTLARELSKIYDLPIVYMDKIAHTESTNPLKDENAFLDKIQQETEKEKWIMEGGYPRTTLPMRMKHADVTILLDFKRKVYLSRVFKRRIQYRNKKRVEMPEEWVEKLDKDFLKYVWSYHKTKRGDVLSAMEKNSDSKKVILDTPRALDKYMESLKTND